MWRTKLLGPDCPIILEILITLFWSYRKGINMHETGMHGSSAASPTCSIPCSMHFREHLHKAWVQTHPWCKRSCQHPFRNVWMGLIFSKSFGVHSHWSIHLQHNIFKAMVKDGPTEMIRSFFRIGLGLMSLMLNICRLNGSFLPPLPPCHNLLNQLKICSWDQSWP